MSTAETCSIYYLYLYGGGGFCSITQSAYELPNAHCQALLRVSDGPGFVTWSASSDLWVEERLEQTLGPCARNRGAGGDLQTHPSVRAIDKPLLAVPPWSSARPLGVTVAGPLADVTYE